MFKPPLYNTEKSRQIISNFKGYDNNPVIDENAFFYEENMSSDNCPMIAPRNKRAFFNVSGKRLHGLFSKEKLCYINNGLLYYGGEAVSGPFFPDLSAERQFVSMGTKLIIFPDKIYVDTDDLSVYGSLEAEYEGSFAECTLCRGDGSLYEGYTVSAIPPENCKHGDLWVDTSATEHLLKQYSQETDTWLIIEDKYIRITATGMGDCFEQYDGVTLSGFAEAALDGAHIIFDKGTDYIVVAGMLDKNITIKNNFKVERKVPDLDFVCENGNRLWGCSSSTNEIFASKLGDPTNFFSYMGISTDSYAATVGTDGEFTGAVSYRNYVLFFKEHCVHKIYGQNPPYTITTSYIRGVQKGSHKSLCRLNETLYYKSPNGICAYDGGVPVDISRSLGKAYYTDAVAGTSGNKYYICMTNVKNERELFVYDEEKSVWHREGFFDVREYTNNNLNLYFVANENGVCRLGLADSVNKFGNFLGELKGYYTENDFLWSVETGLWGLDLPENKYYSGIRIRAIGSKNASLKIYFQFNSDGVWVKQLSVVIEKTGSLNIPFITPRCDHMRVKIEGRGDVKIISVSRNIESGSDLNV